MEGSFTGGIGIGLPLFECKKFTPVLQIKSQLCRCHSRTHTAVITLNERNHVPILVGHRHVDGISFFRLTRGIITGCPVGIVQFQTFFGISFGNQLFHRNISKTRVGIKFGTVFKSQLFYFGEKMNVFGTAKTHRLNIKIFQHI